MGTLGIIQISLAVIALAVSGLAAWYAAKVSREVSSSDYISSERVKSETARLLASLRSMETKGFYAALLKEDVNLTHERQCINEFINSSTGFAYYAWAELKSNQAGEGVSEKWRLLFSHLSRLTYLEDPQQYVPLAVDVEEIFDSLEKNDIKVIMGFNSDLVSGIANAKQGRHGDPLLGAIDDTLRQGQVQESGDRELAIRRLAFLKHEMDVDDPDVDLALAVLEQDMQGAITALGRGADPSGSVDELLERYEDQRGGFEEDDGKD